MLPLRPVSLLEYSPDHSPASAARSVAVPATGTGVLAPPHAVHAAAAVTTTAIATYRDMTRLLERWATAGPDKDS
jgi:O-acetyl-ADP-ribose deacetylase (regulator of RNase III)